MTPLTRRRLQNFRAHRRGYWSLWLFLALFVLSLFAEFIANDQPLLVHFDGHFYFPIFADYDETDFGGDVLRDGGGDEDGGAAGGAPSGSAPADGTSIRRKNAVHNLRNIHPPCADYFSG